MKASMCANQMYIQVACQTIVNTTVSSSESLRLACAPVLHRSRSVGADSNRCVNEFWS